MIKSQNDRVLSVLRKRPLNTVEAMQKMYILRLSARIKNLRDAGYEIATQRVTVGKKVKPYVQYVLVK